MQLTLPQIKTLVDEPYYSRGEAYARQGLVVLKRSTPTEVVALVSGTSPYQVRLFFKSEGVLQGSCTCPYFRDYGPCKHLSAVGLAVLADQSPEGYQPSQQAESDLDEFALLLKRLKKKTKAELIELIQDLCSNDPSLYYQLQEELSYDEA